MDFLGIGPLELFFILIIALIIFGPNDIVKAGKTAGTFLRKLVMSDGWKTFQQARKGMGDLPTTLMREAGIEEEDLRQLSGITDIENATKDLGNTISPWTTPPIKLPDNPANPLDGADAAEKSGTTSPWITPPDKLSDNPVNPVEKSDNGAESEEPPTLSAGSSPPKTNKDNN